MGQFIGWCKGCGRDVRASQDYVREGGHVWHQSCYDIQPTNIPAPAPGANIPDWLARRQQQGVAGINFYDQHAGPIDVFAALGEYFRVDKINYYDDLDVYIVAVTNPGNDNELVIALYEKDGEWLVAGITKKG